MTLRQKGPTLVGVLWMEVFLCLVILCARFYTRLFILRNTGWDDLLLALTWVLMVAFCALCTASATYGMGVHADLLSQHQNSHGMLLLLVGQTVISIAMGLSKCAVTAFLMRIVVNKWHKAFLWFWNITIMALSLLLAISVFAQCTPVQSIWDSRVPQQSCPLDLTQIATVMCAWSAVLDFVLALFPWYALWNLNIKRKEKITICLSLSLGVFAGICGVIRTTSLGALKVSTDYLYATTDSVIWTNSELTTTILCVSAPALRPLYRSLRGQVSSKDASNYNNINGSSYGKTTGNRTRKESYGMDTLVTSVVPKGHERSDSGSDAVKGDEEDVDTRHILSPRPSGTMAQGQHHNIYQTREVIVEYEERRPGDVGEGGSLGSLGNEGLASPVVPVRVRQHI
ncbi:hypothetical protein BDW74DRAFT_189220 [Aspergillus multicolor]|uniref:uncharacterized protein n=1 Tax=Aspergillus multicolor TaxID=41759 RepID=UPI003CCD2893